MPEKYKDEIEEILRKAGEAAPSQSTKESERHPEDRPLESRDTKISPRAPTPEHRTSPRRPTITPGKLMLAGVITLVIGIKFWPLIWVGLALLVGAYLMYFVTPRSLNHEKRWRGRSVEDAPSSYWDQFKRWLRK